MSEVPISRGVASGPVPDRRFEAMMRNRAPCLLAVARRLLRSESEARELVDDAMRTARELREEFRTSNPGDWLQGLVLGLAVSRVERLRHSPADGRDSA